ncbi:hypothetical protein [Actinomycetospora aeridis]|uniref:Uncharacterized protein n=1 Tax=Actinomycetospora aeridis TaxID=3129231 RepID=A0ABU8N6L5_9PSEU
MRYRPMGQHSARRSGGAMTGAVTSVAGRSLFTATAAMALLGGGTSMAFAGEAPSSSGHEQSHGQDAEHAQDDSQGGDDEGCRIPVVDDTTRTGEATVNGLTGDATATVFETGGQATQPVHDALCPPAEDLLGPILGSDQPSSDEAEEDATDEDAAATEEEGTEEGSQEGSEEGSGDEGAPTGTPETSSVSSLPIQGLPA